MKRSLSQQMYTFTMVCCVLFIVLVMGIFWSWYQVEVATERENYAQVVDNHTNNLKQLIISDDIYAEGYTGKNWLILQSKLSTVLGNAPTLSAHQQTIQNSLDSQNKNLKRLFSQIRTSKLHQVSHAIKKHLRVRLITQLESIRADSLTLAAIMQEDIQQVIRAQALLIILTVAVSICILLFGAIKLSTIFTTSLKEVKQAFEQNHSGNFQKITLSYQSPEFDSIVTAFNGMNKKLSETTVSLEAMKTIVKEKTSVLEQLSKTDPLTQVANRRALFERGNMEFSRVARTQGDLALILMDCDLFKQVNDEYGHLIGDELLKHVCRLCQQEIREMDFLGRYGGEEFIIILPHCDLSSGIDIAHRIQQSLNNTSLVFEGQTIAMTLSMGISIVTDKHQSFEQLINDADKAMYQAKEKGRNRIEISHEISLH